MAYSLLSLLYIVAMDMMILSTLLEVVYCVMCTLALLRYENYLLHAMCTDCALVHWPALSLYWWLYINCFIGSVAAVSTLQRLHRPGKSQHEAG